MSIRPLRHKKIYVDSKHRTSDSRSTSDLKIQLQESFEIPEGTIMQVHEVSLPNVFHTVELGANNRICFITFDGAGNKTGQYSTQFSQSYNYTAPQLAEAVAKQMKLAYGTPDTYSGVYQPAINNIQIKATSAPLFKIVTKDELKQGYEGYWDEGSNTFSSLDRRNISETIGNYEYSTSQVNATMSGDFINLIPCSSIYIECPELSNNNFHNPSGYSNSVVKKISVNSPFSQVINDNSLTVYDYVNTSKRTIQQLTFRITDEAGNVINLHRVNATFSLLI